MGIVSRPCFLLTDQIISHTKRSMEMDAFSERQRLDLAPQELNGFPPKSQGCSERLSPSSKCSSSDRLMMHMLPFLNESSCIVRNEAISTVSDQALSDGWGTGSSGYSYWQMGCLGGGEAPAEDAPALMTAPMLNSLQSQQAQPSREDENELRLLRSGSWREANGSTAHCQGSAYPPAFSSEQQVPNVDTSMLDSLAPKLEGAPNAYADVGLPPFYAANLHSDRASAAIIDADELLLRRQLLRSQMLFSADRPYVQCKSTPDLLCFPHATNVSLPSLYAFQDGLEACSVEDSLQNLHNLQGISYNFLQLPSEAVIFQEAEVSVPLSNHNTGWLKLNTSAISSETNVSEKPCLTENVKDEASTRKRPSYEYALGQTTDANKRLLLETGTESARSSVWVSPAISNSATTMKQGASITPQHKSSSSSSVKNSTGWPALNTNLKPRARQGSAADPQSIAARHRRERISERLKILQDLVPNGSKVDLVTMLEKAISYVKFLQLQVNVLRTDEYWPNHDQ
ncbi:hypothetical protein O6H91_06G127400 [Diphasiastrum complanatum]|uniref:Uncharacterized protein n=1 Tax=Diphasiastrum complanatum TaxID=34168 RepID=A0ACC2DIY9_DIPCM|nr:hypothetical protein O6H91_06G127400 [Diphasiastrum complanatum]